MTQNQVEAAAGLPPGVTLLLPADTVISRILIMILLQNNTRLSVTRQDFEKVTRQKCPVSPNKQEVRGQAVKGNKQSGQEICLYITEALGSATAQLKVHILPCHLLFWAIQCVLSLLNEANAST